MAEALAKVDDILTKTQDWVGEFAASANTAIANLGDWTPSYTWVGTLTNPTVNVSVESPGRVPVPPAGSQPPKYLTIEEVGKPTKDFGSPPSEPSLHYPQVPGPPGLTEPNYTAPVPPALSPINVPPSPSLPTPSMEAVSKPDFIDISMPDGPKLTIPQMNTASKPTMQQVQLPRVPSVNFRDFTIAPPEELCIEPANFSFSIDNIDIEGDSLFLAEKNRLWRNIVYGKTGLIESVENDIWNRDLERNEQTLSDSTDKAFTVWAKKGFSLPNGMLAHSVSELQKEYENKRIDRSRDIAIKQAELEQANLFKSMELGTGLFLGVKELVIKYQELVLRCQEDTAKYFNEYITLQIQIHNDSIEIFKAMLAVYEAEIKGKAAEIEIYRAQLEAELSKLKMNEINASIYATETQSYLGQFNGMLQANKTIIDTYVASVEGEVAKSRVNESKVGAYSAEVNAAVSKYNGEISGSKLLVDVFTSQIGAEETRARVNESLAKMFSAKIEGEVAKVNAQASVNKAKSESFAATMQGVLATAQIEELKVRQYSEAVKGFIARVEAYAAECNSMRAEAEIEQSKAMTNQSMAIAWAQEQAAKNATYIGSLEAYKATSDYNVATARLSTDVAKMNADILMATRNLNQSYLQFGVSSLQASEHARLEALKSVADLSANLAGGAMSTLNAGARIDYGESMTLAE
jgi:hypothetical protein